MRWGHPSYESPLPIKAVAEVTYGLDLQVPEIRTRGRAALEAGKRQL